MMGVGKPCKRKRERERAVLVRMSHLDRGLMCFERIENFCMRPDNKMRRYWKEQVTFYRFPLFVCLSA